MARRKYPTEGAIMVAESDARQVVLRLIDRRAKKIMDRLEDDLQRAHYQRGPRPPATTVETMLANEYDRILDRIEAAGFARPGARAEGRLPITDAEAQRLCTIRRETIRGMIADLETLTVDAKLALFADGANMRAALESFADKLLQLGLD